MVKSGWKRRHAHGSDEEDEVADYAFIYANEQTRNILKTAPLQHFIYSQYLKYISHICRTENTALAKILL